MSEVEKREPFSDEEFCELFLLASPRTLEVFEDVTSEEPSDDESLQKVVPPTIKGLQQWFVDEMFEKHKSIRQLTAKDNVLGFLNGLRVAVELFELNFKPVDSVSLEEFGLDIELAQEINDTIVYDETHLNIDDLIYWSLTHLNKCFRQTDASPKGYPYDVRNAEMTWFYPPSTA